MAEQKSTHITWHDGRIGRREREALLKQRGATLWLTGLSGSGKSTLAVTTEAALVERGHLAYVLDGDNVRHGLTGTWDSPRTTGPRTFAASVKWRGSSPRPA